MADIETDYLVVGAGASGMAFTDALIAECDRDVVIVDRRHRPGGHWIDAYPFVRLHQPSANYGVNSRVLGHDRIDDAGPNAGHYERATAAEVCDYYDRVLEQHLLPSGQVRFFGMSDYLGSDSDGHRFVSKLTGDVTTVKVRRKLVDTTYAEGTIPSRHTPAFDVDGDVRLIAPHELVDLAGSPTGYTVLGAGKTAMDTCCWLLDHGVNPDEIRWVRPRDVWAFDRSATQPLELLGSQLEFMSRLVEAIAEMTDGTSPLAVAGEMFRRLEGYGLAHRLDESVEPTVFRGVVLSQLEVDALRQLSNVIRKGRVRRISTDRVVLEHGSVPSDPEEVYVDCTASALKVAPVRPVFEEGRMTMQVVTLGIVPRSAATLGYVEASRDDDGEKNRLCPPLGITGELGDPRPIYVGLKAPTERMAEPDIAAWDERSRLNPMRGVTDHLGDPRVAEGLARMAVNMAPALANLERIMAASKTPVSV